ncbi:MAG: Uma2 family endonuclease [Cyanobacteria bacterium P01_A01_bin.114]
MVASKPTSHPQAHAAAAPKTSRFYALEAFIKNPIDDAEWVDGQIIEKEDMTVKHGIVQGQLSHLWQQYADSVQDDGRACTEAPCCTLKQVRRPDVAFIPADLLDKYGQPATFPESFPLIAEIVSPSDSAEDVFAKAKEYLASGCQEVWMVFPEAEWVLVLTENQHLWFTADEVAMAQTVLKGFSVKVKDLVS